MKFKLIYQSKQSLSGDQIEYFIFYDLHNTLARDDYKLTLQHPNRAHREDYAVLFDKNVRTLFKWIDGHWDFRVDKVYWYNNPDLSCTDERNYDCTLVKINTYRNINYDQLDRNYLYLKKTGMIFAIEMLGNNIYQYAHIIYTDYICFRTHQRYTKTGNMINFETYFAQRDQDINDSSQTQSFANNEIMCLYNTKKDLYALNKYTGEYLQFYYHKDYELLIAAIQKAGSNTKLPKL